MQEFLVEWFKLCRSHANDKGVYRTVFGDIFRKLGECFLAVLSVENLCRIRRWMTWVYATIAYREVKVLLEVSYKVVNVIFSGAHDDQPGLFVC